jgi:hypothetical protein
MMVALGVGAVAATTTGCDEEGFQRAKAYGEQRAQRRAQGSGESASEQARAPQVEYDRLERSELNRRAAKLYVPLFWQDDRDGDGAVSPAELVTLWGMPGAIREGWIEGGSFTPRFSEIYERMVAGRFADEEKQPPAEAKRRASVRKELDQGQPMVIHTSFKGASKQDRAIVTHLLNAARLIEQIFAKQRGWWQLRNPPPPDAASRMLLYRNQGPWCEAPQTETDESCNALPSLPKQRSGLYPATVQEDAEFCDALAKREDGEQLLHQFHVVRERDGELVAVPYHEEYAEEMAAISQELRAAAAAIEGADERAFKKYLLAAASAFENDDWPAADEAWAKMNAENSTFYLRIGPDEVYFEPCSRKAGFHVSFARINQDSLAWQRKLDPVKNDLEQALATLAGEPYEARKVSFHLPDFVDIVLNAGDSRSPMGATIGQSLPNWGKVANEGRGRTVAMTNLYTDPDSLAVLRSQASSILCPGTYGVLSTEPEPMIMSTVLHEAAHNLGPAHEYEVDGKKDSAIFGGPLSTTMEELKAQTAALYFSDWLADAKIVTTELARQAHVRDVVWAFSHISRGMYTAKGKPRPYSQLAGIQVGYLTDKGAAEWRAEAKAANGQDAGCYELDLDRFPEVVEELMREVAGIKARGDRKAAEQLVESYVDVKGEPARVRKVIEERWQRAPKATFVYSIEM